MNSLRLRPQDVNHAIEFYQARIEELSITLKEIETVVQQKREHVSAVQEGKPSIGSHHLSVVLTKASCVALRQKLEPAAAQA